DLQEEFGTPEIKIQKKIKNALDWQKFDGWKEFLEKFVERQDVKDLLDAPMGPLLGEKISDGSGVTDIILKQSKRKELKASVSQFKEDLDDTLDMLKTVWEWQPPDKEEHEGHPASRKLIKVLNSLGLMSGDKFKLAPNLTVWSVVDRIMDELDGFPVYISGLNSQKDKYNRIAVTLASQKSKTDDRKKFFGVAGLAYNILLNPVSDKDKDGDSGKPSIVLSKDNFTSDESILIDPEEDEQEEPESGGGDTQPEETPAKKEVSKVDILLQLGKWFSGETLDDNWMLRLLPK